MPGLDLEAVDARAIFSTSASMVAGPRPGLRRIVLAN
jgi:hypothetical protein